MRGVPTNPVLLGPFTREDELMPHRREGVVAIDDVGTPRQFRYGNSHMGSGWTAQGCSPLSTKMLVEDGRPVWILTYDLSPKEES